MAKASKTVGSSDKIPSQQPKNLGAGAASAPVAAVFSDTRQGKRTEYRIYPSIGISRIGDSKDGFFMGPEAPRVAPKGPYRGQTDKGILPQAARFRVYRVDIDENENENVIEEVIASATVAIEWSVTLANRKASGSRIYAADGGTLGRTANPLPRNPGLDRAKLVISSSGKISGVSLAGPVLAGSIEFAPPGSNGPRVDDIKLASLRTDEAGRLLVVAGPGTSGSPANTKLSVFSDNDGWYDSVSDGPVEASVTINGAKFDVVSAWAVITVPRYAPEVYGIITWYDQAVSMARTSINGTFSPPKTTSFTQDIYPLLKRADGLSAVHAGTHSDGAPALSNSASLAGLAASAARAAVAKKLTPLGTDSTAPQELPSGTMPQLYSGANPDPSGPVWVYLSLTKYQMAHIRNWVNGNYAADWPGAEPSPPAFDKLPVARQAWALTEAALEACVGGSFFPGIEGTYIIAQADTYHSESNLRQEFRINPTHPAGYLTERMALPWQADFADCSDYWWPSQRPVNVTTAQGAQENWDRGIAVTNDQARHLNMVSNWMKLGFVVRDEATGKFVETERTLGVLVS
jgi:hypothetical protein